jgi:hypothetical protein
MSQIESKEEKTSFLFIKNYFLFFIFYFVDVSNSPPEKTLVCEPGYPARGFSGNFVSWGCPARGFRGDFVSEYAAGGWKIQYPLSVRLKGTEAIGRFNLIPRPGFEPTVRIDILLL